MRKKVPKNKPVWAMCKCMVSMATRNAILKNGGVPKNSLISAATNHRLLNLVIKA